MTRIAWAFALLLAGCGSAPPPAGVLVERLADGDWRATWQAAEPIRTLRFVRAAHYLREREWRVATPGYEFAREGDAQILRLRDGAQASDRLVVEFPVNTAFLARDYELFNVFSDGSTAVYTGHFHASVNDADRPLDEVTVAAPDGTRVLVDATPGDRGTYAYVGDIAPVEDEHVAAVIDPGLPRWLVATFAQRIPELFELYSARTGRPLTERPLVLFSFVPGDGYDINGGVLENLVQLRVSGDVWRDDNPWAVRAALRLLAHEAAHLWNSQLARVRPGAPSWLHEGGAEAFADAALHELEILGDDGLRRAHERALNECVNARRSDYSCGEVAAWWTDLAVRAARPGADLFAFWGALAARAEAGDGYYGADEYFAELAAFGVPADDIARLRAFTAPSADPAAALRDGVARYGIRVRRDDASADGPALLAASAATMFALLELDCGGGYGFYSHERTLELAGLEDCTNAREGAQVDRFGPEPLVAPAFAAARYVADRCAVASSVTVGDAEFACPDELPPLHGYWTITGEMP